MENWLYATVCCPISLIATAVNVIFIVCLHHPVEKVKLQQPLRLLIIALLCNSTSQQCTVLVTILFAFLDEPHWLLLSVQSLSYLTYCSFFSSTAWISIVYYIKIVPQHHALFVWIKKHMKVVVYCGFIFDQITLLVAMSLGTISLLLSSPLLFNATSETMSDESNETDYDRLAFFLVTICRGVFAMYLVIPILTLSFSWGKTFVHLHGHIRHMEQTTRSKSSPQQQNQMRVTIMGIVQTALFIPSCLWTLFTVLVYATPLFNKIDGNRHITFTVTSISNLVNIVCLGFSQSVFRFGVAAKWKSLRRALDLVGDTKEMNM